MAGPHLIAAQVQKGQSVIRVSADGKGLYDYRTLQEALTAAAAVGNAVIEVGPGTYDEQLTIPTSVTNLTLRGAGREATKIVYTGVSDSFIIQTAQYFQGKLLLENLSVEHTGSGAGGLALNGCLLLLAGDDGAANYGTPDVRLRQVRLRYAGTGGEGTALLVNAADEGSNRHSVTLNAYESSAENFRAAVDASGNIGAYLNGHTQSFFYDCYFYGYKGAVLCDGLSLALPAHLVTLVGCYLFGGKHTTGTFPQQWILGADNNAFVSVFSTVLQGFGAGTDTAGIIVQGTSGNNDNTTVRMHKGCSVSQVELAYYNAADVGYGWILGDADFSAGQPSVSVVYENNGGSVSFSTIQEAINWCDDSGVDAEIHLGPHTYDELITIPSTAGDLTFKGSLATQLAASGDGDDIVTVTDGYIGTLVFDTVTIHGIQTTTEIVDGIVWASTTAGGALILKDCVFSMDAGNALVISNTAYNSGPPPASSVSLLLSVRGCTITAANATAVSLTGAFSGVEFTDTRISATGARAVLLDGNNYLTAAYEDQLLSALFTGCNLSGGSADPLPVLDLQKQARATLLSTYVFEKVSGAYAIKVSGTLGATLGGAVDVRNNWSIVIVGAGSYVKGEINAPTVGATAYAGVLIGKGSYVDLDDITTGATVLGDDTFAGEGSGEVRRLFVTSEFGAAPSWLLVPGLPQFNTIQAAVDYARTNKRFGSAQAAIIYVAPGAYTGFTLTGSDGNVTIQGAGRDKTIIQNSGSNPAVYLNDYDGTLHVNDCTVRATSNTPVTVDVDCSSADINPNVYFERCYIYSTVNAQVIDCDWRYDVMGVFTLCGCTVENLSANSQNIINSNGACFWTLDDVRINSNQTAISALEFFHDRSQDGAVSAYAYFDNVEVNCNFASNAIGMTITDYARAIWGNTRFLGGNGSSARGVVVLSTADVKFLSGEIVVLGGGSLDISIDGIVSGAQNSIVYMGAVYYQWTKTYIGSVGSTSNSLIGHGIRQAQATGASPSGGATTGLGAGYQIYDNNSNTLYIWDGSTWQSH